MKSELYLTSRQMGRRDTACRCLLLSGPSQSRRVHGSMDKRIRFSSVDPRDHAEHRNYLFDFHRRSLGSQLSGEQLNQTCYSFRFVNISSHTPFDQTRVGMFSISAKAAGMIKTADKYLGRDCVTLLLSTSVKDHTCKWCSILIFGFCICTFTAWEVA